MAHDTIVNIEHHGRTKFVTRVGFQGFDQEPLVLVWKEHVETTRGKEKVVYAEVLYILN